ncbi:FOXRED1 [Acanthosepion pharaonis]|uniref:FAD-dependent oxidoreductase domain-containing protein 1 n=1 Tax=Acanthosepion pharaonis TaxID=158019 RepID=A0A812EX78_ACAPH|nr:FOXRED1 [Sepia pharaonis]
MRIARNSYRDLCRIFSQPLFLQRTFSSHDDKPPLPVIPRAGSHRSPWEVLKEEFRALKQGNFTSESNNKVPRESDILIIGGGLIGSSVAYWLKQRNPKAMSITIVERDPSYTRAASVLSVGGIRHQFSLPENVQLSMFTSEFLRNIKQHLSVLDMDPPDIQFNLQGYLFLASPEGAEQLVRNAKMQRDIGAKVELMSRERLASKFPWLNLQGIELGTYGLEGEGWFDPWTLIRAMKQKNLSLGVKYVNGEVIGFDKQTYRVAGTDGYEDRESINSVQIKSEGEIYQSQFAIVINCAGPWAGNVAELAGIGTGKGILSLSLPVEPRKRYVYVFHCPKGPGIESPFLIDPAGFYFRREGLGSHFLCGMSPTEEDEPAIDNLQVDYDYFHNTIWPHLAHRVSKFESLKLMSAWSGFYDYNYADQNLVIGNHPYFHNFYFANGLSGHGIQHAPAIGRALMEYIIDGNFESIDLSRFKFDRFLSNDLLTEVGIV